VTKAVGNIDREIAGALMLHGGVADKIVALAKSAVGHIRGTGRRPDADGPQHDHLRAGSRRRSIDRALIVAGLLPALVLMLCMLAAAYLVAVKRGYPAGTFPGSNAVGRAAIAGVPGLLIIVIILAGILSGVFTATEAAAVAVTYTILLTFLVYRTMTWDHFLEAAAKAVKTTGVVLLLIGVSAMFQYLMGLYEVADFTGNLVAKISTTPWIVFLVINVILFVLGTFMDMAATILICTPIFLPIAMKYGMDPVQFGMLMLINCALGLNTPPVGTVQFVGCAIGGISVGAVMKTIMRSTPR